MGALLALVASVAWGSADVAGGVGSRRVGSVRVIAMAYPAGAIVLTLFAMFVIPGTIDRDVLLLSLATSLVGTAGMILLYAALATGPIDPGGPDQGGRAPLALVRGRRPACVQGAPVGASAPGPVLTRA